jgi:hypothetical protein
VPSAAIFSAWISLNDESSRTNAFALLSMRKMRPGDSVPASRLPPLSSASVTTLVVFVL